ncbi:estrogen-related receptor gamma-like isoform X2 [Babylonia areolata]|uniref:estrogen-related receptor gamma-like isoform X2 n=1 Tax=Babylonia areolata TaxID=304850 RepID=UPI003FCF8B4C
MIAQQFYHPLHKDIDDYQYHIGTLWSSGMDLGDMAVKHEPPSPMGGMGHCTQPTLEEQFANREYFSDFPLTDDYGSDPGDSPPGSGNISPSGSENSKVLDFEGGGGKGMPDISSSSLQDSSSPEQDSGDGMKRCCLVCFDTASGYHYGVSSCEACKAFFKRTIQGNIEYSCPANGECEITKRRRKACQACRFQKCLRVGMLREGVRLDRVRGGRQKYKRNENGTTLIQPLVSSVPKKPCNETTTTLIDNRYLSTLLALESQLDKLFVSKDYDYADEDVAFRAAISDVADRELVITISWAKQVPGFSTLELVHQMSLLQNSWLEVMCLSLVYRSCPYVGHVCYAEDLQLPEEKVEACKIPQELDSQIRKVCKKFTSLRVSHEEYVLLKAIILCNFDVLGQEPQEVAVRNLQDRLQDSLIDCIRARHGSNPRRLGQLFLVLPAITHVRLLYKQFWEDLRDDGRVMMHKLFQEMLESTS